MASRLKDVACNKNPRHSKFLSLSQVTQDTLPRGFQKHSIAEIIKLKGAETVLLEVSYTSTQRPASLGFSNFKVSCTCMENLLGY